MKLKAFLSNEVVCSVQVDSDVTENQVEQIFENITELKGEITIVSNGRVYKLTVEDVLNNAQCLGIEEVYNEKSHLASDVAGDFQNDNAASGTNTVLTPQ